MLPRTRGSLDLLRSLQDLLRFSNTLTQGVATLPEGDGGLVEASEECARGKRRAPAREEGWREKGRMLER